MTGIVTHHEHAVGGPARVELDAVGTELGGQPEGLDGVLGGPPAGAPVGENERSVGHLRHRKHSGPARHQTGTGFTSARERAGQTPCHRRTTTVSVNEGVGTDSPSML